MIGVHGYSSCSLYDFPGIAQLYHNHGFNVLLVDDRGHGDSEGEYAGFGVLDHKDVLKWIDYIIKEIDPKAEIYLHGISMGGASVLFAGGCELRRMCGPLWRTVRLRVHGKRSIIFFQINIICRSSRL